MVMAACTCVLAWGKGHRGGGHVGILLVAQLLCQRRVILARERGCVPDAVFDDAVDLRDIPLLAKHFVEKICRQEDIPPERITAAAAIDSLCLFSWPGNVRQLESAVEVAVAHPGATGLCPSHAGCSEAGAGGAPVVSVPDDGLAYEHTLAGIDRSILEQALPKTGGNKRRLPRCSA
jgi:hypothetical protein